MQYGAILAYIFVLMSVAAGCSTARPDGGTISPEAAQEIKSLRDENRKLTDHNKILTARLEELQAREKHLTKRINSLTFFNARQREQIDALADAPVARDAYKKKSQELALENDRLYKRNAQLEKLIASPRSGPPSGTQPTAP